MMTLLSRTALWRIALVSLGLCGLLAPRSAVADPMPAKPVADQIRINPKDGAVMVFIPAGHFMMGSYPNDDQADPDEFPLHDVNLDGFWMYQTVVSVAQYRIFCNETGQPMPAQPAYGWDDDNPIVNVTWNDAVAYSKWAGARLPTEAEWEKGARGFCGNLFPWGDDWEDGRCACAVNQQANGPSPVKSFIRSRSQFGLYGMCGNVWQWCADRYSATYYDDSPRNNPTGPTTSMRRVTRGGSWRDDSVNILRSANRNRGLPTEFDNNVGFRCALSGE